MPRSGYIELARSRAANAARRLDQDSEGGVDSKVEGGAITMGSSEWRVTLMGRMNLASQMHLETKLIAAATEDETQIT